MISNKTSNVRQFLIRPVSDEWFNIPYSKRAEILAPRGIAHIAVEGWGTHRINVEGEEISFSDEDVGVQVSFETGFLPDTRVNEIIESIRANIESQTGQRARLVPI